MVTEGMKILLVFQDFKNVMIYPHKFFQEIEDRKIKDVAIYIFIISLFVFLLTQPLLIFITKKYNFKFIPFIFIVWFSISLLSILPITILRWIHTPKEMKIYLKNNPAELQKVVSRERSAVFKVVGYSITPIILFSMLSYISKYFTYLSWYWIIIGTIGISKVLKISKIEAFISLIIAYSLAVILFFEPLMLLT